MRIFISYGRRDAGDFAARLVDGLRGQGHEPWLDVENGIPIGTPFDIRIEDGIRGCDVVIALLSRWSVREDGFCRNELLYAQACGKPIIPVRLADVLPPIQIFSLNYLDALGESDAILERLAAVLEEVRQGGSVARRQWAQPGAAPPWWAAAPGLHFDEELARYGGEFVGREWLFSEVARHLAQPHARLLLLTADAGVGKSAIAAQLTARLNVKGIHFCSSSQADSCKPAVWLAGLVYQLASGVPPYREQVERLPPPDWNEPIESLFRRLIADPLRACQGQVKPADPWVLVIDGLDEAASAGPQFVHFLADSAERLPDWMRLVVTSRPDEDLLTDLKIDRVRRSHLEAEGQGNLDDLERYVERRLQAVGAAVLPSSARGGIRARLPHLATGNFLFARVTLDALTDPDPALRLSLDELGQLPEKLGGLYKAMFRKRFGGLPQSEYEDRIVPLLDCLAAARGPLPEELLLKASGLDRRAGRRSLLALSQFLTRTAPGLRLFHKSFADWLADPEASGTFCADARSGHDRLAEVGFAEFVAGSPLSPYVLAHLPGHLRAAERWSDLLALLGDLRFLADNLAAGRLFALVRSWAELGERASAAETYRRALRQVETKLADRPEELVRHFRNVGKLLRATKELREAETILHSAVELERRRVGDDHPEYADCLAELGSLRHALGDYAAAEPLHRRALEIRRARLGERHPDFAASLDHLGAVYRGLGRYAEAEGLCREALRIREAVLGRHHPDVAASLNNLAELREALGNYVEAERLYREALTLRRQILGEDHPDHAVTQNNLAALLRQMGNYVEAEPLYRQALQTHAAAVGEGHPGYATDLDNLAELYRAMGRYLDAEPLYRQALEIRRRVFGDEHPHVARSLSQLGLLRQAAGKYLEAQPFHEEALEIQRRALGEEHPNYADGLSNLAGLYVAMAFDARAEPLYRRALEIRRRVLGERHPLVADSLRSLGLLAQRSGDHGAAEVLCREAVDIFRAALGDRHPEVAAGLHQLAGVDEAAGNYAGAEQLYREALAIRREALGREHPDYATSLSTLASLYNRTGNSGIAERMLREALAIRGTALSEDHPDLATGLHNLALVHVARGNCVAAEPLYLQALAIRRQSLGELHPVVAATQTGLAEVYRVMGRYAEAEPLLRQAVEIRRTVLGEDHPDFATTLHALAALYHAMGDLAAAEPLYRQALAIEHKVLGDEHPDLGRTLHALATLCAACNRLDEAFALLQGALAIDERMLGQVFSIASENQRLGFLATLRKGHDTFLSLARLRPDANGVHSALDLTLRRKGLASSALAVQRDSLVGGKYPHLQPLLDEINLLRRHLTRRTLAGPIGLDAIVHRQTLAEASTRKETLEAELARQIPEMNLLPALRAADHRAVAAALPEGTALVEFVRFNVFDFGAVPARAEAEWHPARYLAFVLPGSGPDGVRMLDLGEADGIDRLLADFRSHVSVPPEEHLSRNLRRVPLRREPSAETHLGERLRGALFDPLVPALGPCRVLLLCPDGELSRLPFEVLPTREGGRLIDSYRICYVSSGREVLRFEDPTAGPPGAPVVLADPDFDLTAETPPALAVREVLTRDLKTVQTGHFWFGRLPGTRVEGEQVAALLGVRPWLDGDALEGRLKAVRSPRILHLATHGFFLPERQAWPSVATRGIEVGGLGGELSDASSDNPLLRSGLALAGANTFLQGSPLPAEAEDGLLTAEDVTGLDLRDTRLVVLSACDSGLGEIMVGEGVLGLRHAFQLAGARTVVMTLWAVPDEQTTELVVDFYRRVLAGQGCADALRNAQLTLKAKYPHPFYWGGFVCHGAPTSLC
jgi:tetratricopeptide (TPR) repeat protein/CHAT domain-containing protein